MLTTRPTTHFRPLALAAAAFLMVTACGGDDPTDDTAMMDSTQAPAATTMAEPDTTAEAVWAYLEQQQYSTWATWPGKAALYPGTEPHGMLLTTYVNELAHDAITNGATAMPVGAILVKENYRPDSTLAAITVMYKRGGYDAAHNDWFWLKRLATGEVEASGRVESCQACHAQSATDFIRTQALGTAASGTM